MRGGFCPPASFGDPQHRAQRGGQRRIRFERRAVVRERLGPVGGPVAEQLRERRARRSALRLERERAAVGVDRAVDVLERACAQAAELVEHVGQGGRIVSRMALRELGERSAGGAPLSLCAQQPRGRDRRLHAAGIRRRGDAEGLGRQACLAEALQGAPAQRRQRRAFGRVRDLLQRAGGDVERARPRVRTPRAGSPAGARRGRGPGRPPGRRADAARPRIRAGPRAARSRPRAADRRIASRAPSACSAQLVERSQRRLDAAGAFVQQGDPIVGLGAGGVERERLLEARERRVGSPSRPRDSAPARPGEARAAGSAPGGRDTPRGGGGRRRDLPVRSTPRRARPAPRDPRVRARAPRRNNAAPTPGVRARSRNARPVARFRSAVRDLPCARAARARARRRPSAAPRSPHASRAAASAACTAGDPESRRAARSSHSRRPGRVLAPAQIRRAQPGIRGLGAVAQRGGVGPGTSGARRVSQRPRAPAPRASRPPAGGRRGRASAPPARAHPQVGPGLPASRPGADVRRPPRRPRGRRTSSRSTAANAASVAAAPVQLRELGRSRRGQRGQLRRLRDRRAARARDRRCGRARARPRAARPLPAPLRIRSPSTSTSLS